MLDVKMDHKQEGTARPIVLGASIVSIVSPVVTIGGVVYLVRRGNYGFATILVAPMILTVGAMGLLMFLATRPSSR